MSVECDGMECDGVECDGAECDGVECDGVECDGVDVMVGRSPSAIFTLTYTASPDCRL